MKIYFIALRGARMKITKYGHCCLLGEENGQRVLTDPGMFTQNVDGLTDIDFILITHWDIDHLHTETLKKILRKNPQAVVITNTQVGTILQKEGILFTLVEDGQRYAGDRIIIEGFGKKHAPMHETYPRQENTGYLIQDKFFYAGDALTLPNRAIEILALPTVVPWAKFSEIIDYAREVHPKKVVPVHDGYMSPPGVLYGLFIPALEEYGIKFMSGQNGEEMST
jgi:L-ascorbate metabolism protein UlaG (beta-lactamase superfamily)